MPIYILLPIIFINKILSKENCYDTYKAFKVCSGKTGLKTEQQDYTTYNTNSSQEPSINIEDLKIRNIQLETENDNLEIENKDLTDKINNLYSKKLEIYLKLKKFIDLRKNIEDKKNYLLENKFAKEVKIEDIDISKFIKNNSNDINEESFDYITERNRFYNDIDRITKFNKLKKFVNEEIEKCNKMIDIHNKKVKNIKDHFKNLEEIDKSIKENEKKLENNKKIIENNKKELENNNEQIQEYNNKINSLKNISGTNTINESKNNSEYIKSNKNILSNIGNNTEVLVR